MPAKRGRKKKSRVPQPIDESKPLKKAEHEAFAQNYVNGDGVKPSSKGGFTVCKIPAVEAYVRAGYKNSTGARAAASKMLKKCNIAARIEYLAAEQATMLAERGCATKQECCIILTSIIRARHSDFLSMGDDGVCMFDVGDETLNQAALKKIKTRISRDELGNTVIERQFDEIELEGKIPAIKCLADINGWNKADENAADMNTLCKQLIDQLVPPVPEEKRSPITG